jgi:hypothetical protein
MNEFTDVLKRTDLNSIASFLLYGIDDMDEITDSYSEKMNAAYEDYYASMKKVFPDAAIDEEDMNNIVAGFSGIESDVYFKVGLLIGFQIYKFFDEGYDKSKAGELNKIISDFIASQEKDTDK